MTITDLYNITPIPTLKDNYVWAIINKPKVLIVDPGEAAPVAEFLQRHRLDLAGIIITHHHWDHTNGIINLINQYPAPVWGPSKENIPGITHPLHDNDKINLDSFPIELTIIAIPGHTLGHIAYYARGMLFCGDTLFAAGCGRLFEGTALQLYTSLQKIAALPEDTNIYCAHEYTLNNLHFAQTVEPNNKQITELIAQISALRKQGLPSLPSTLRKEKATNPFLRCDSPDVKENVEQYANKKLNDPLEIFTYLRKWKDGWSS